MQADQQKLFANLRKQQVKYSLGYLLKSKDKVHEKGVDVNMAVDILVASFENLADRIILVSSDTDLLPAIKKAREKDKVVEYIGFSHQPSLAMVANCSESRLLKKQNHLPFIVPSKYHGCKLVDEEGVAIGDLAEGENKKIPRSLDRGRFILTKDKNKKP